MLGGVSLGGTKEVVHIYIHVLETVGRGGLAVGSIVRPIRGRVYHKDRGGVQVSAIVIISDCLGCGTKKIR